MDKKQLKKFCAGEIERAFRLGVPGSGKTHGIFTEILPAYFKANPKALVAVLAFTNKAVAVVREYAQQFSFGERIQVMTIHKFCKLVPTLNDSATKHKDLHGNRRTGDADDVDLIIIDEIGMVDDVLAAALDDCFIEGKYSQAIACGDYEQVKPVNGEPAIMPKPDDWVERLTEVKRSDAPDIAAFIQQFSAHIADGCKGKRLKLVPSDNIRAGVPRDAQLTVAWRNRTVQQHNAELQGYAMPRINDRIYCDTLKNEFTVLDVIPAVNFEEYTWLKRQVGRDGEPVYLHAEDDQYKTLHRAYTTLRPRLTGELIGLHLRSDDGEECHVMCVFGTGDFRDSQKKLMEGGMEGNEAVLAEFKLKYHPNDTKKKQKRVIDSNGKVFGNLKAFCDSKRGVWPNIDDSHESIEERRLAWGAYMIMQEVVFHADFTHARTVHAMQGSSVDTVFVDVADMARADDDTYHRLVYVGGSRARKTIFFG